MEDDPLEKEAVGNNLRILNLGEKKDVTSGCRGP
jgi:hypothetical protein